MRPPPLIRGSHAVGGGADKRVAEPDPSAELTQPGLDRGRRRLSGDAAQLGGPPHEDGIPERVGCRDEQQPPRLVRQHPDPSPEILIEPGGHR